MTWDLKNIFSKFTKVTFSKTAANKNPQILDHPPVTMTELCIH